MRWFPILLPLIFAIGSSLLASRGHAQVPDAPPVAPVPAAGNGGGGGGGGGNYRRPDLSSAALDLTNLTISKEQRELLVNRLTLLARNFTDSKLLNKEWRARALALALRLDPNDRSCIVANGQWARGVVPQPVDSPLKLDAVAVDLLKVATEILKTSPAPASPEHALCLHLLDLVTRLDVTNRAVFELFSKDSPQLRWDALVPAKPSRPSLQEEETPDLLLSKTSINLPLYRQQDGRKVVTVRPFAATAQKLPPGQKRPLQVYLPPDSDRELENALPNLRTILKARNPQWPAGWRVDLGPLTASPSAQPGSILGVAVVLESLVTGTQLDPLAIPACGLDPGRGIISKTMEMSLILKIGREAPAGTMLILAEPDINEVYDLLLLQPERWADITRVPLCTAHTFSECFTLCSADRPKLLQQSLDQFRELTAKVIVSGLTSLRDPENEQKLDELLIINPNLLSAKVLQTAAQKRMPTVLSKGGSLRVLQQLGEPMLKAGSKQYPLKVAWTNKLDPSPWASARTRVDRLRPLLYPDAKLYADALSDLAKIYDGMVMNFSTNPQTREDVKRRVAEVRKRLKLAGGLLEEKTASAAESAGELLSDGLGDF